MIPLHHDPHFTFRFGETRIISRFHLEGLLAGTPVSVMRLDPATETRQDLIRHAVVGAEGWVDLSEPLIMHAGEGFVVLPEMMQNSGGTQTLHPESSWKQ
jgi:hypothetical protein